MARRQSQRLQTLDKENVAPRTHAQGKRKTIRPTPRQRHSTCLPSHHLSPIPDPTQLQESSPPPPDPVQPLEFSPATVHLQELTHDELTHNVLPQIFSPIPDSFPASPQTCSTSLIPESRVILNSSSESEIRNLQGTYSILLIFCQCLTVSQAQVRRLEAMINVNAGATSACPIPRPSSGSSGNGFNLCSVMELDDTPDNREIYYSIRVSTLLSILLHVTHCILFLAYS